MAQVRRLIEWLFPICAFVVALSVAFKAFAGETWGLEWFAADGKTMMGAPEYYFPSHEDCVTFGDDRVAYAEVVAGIHITYRCVRLPIREA